MPARHVLIVGAAGFIGRRLAARLLARGDRVTCAARDPAASRVRFPACVAMQADLAHDSANEWAVRLAGVDVVVNAAGVLRGALDEIQHRGAVALLDGCARASVPTVLQVSALGAGQQPGSRFLATKARADDHLAALAAQGGRAGWHVVRPSVVIGRGGASTALFCALAALPVRLRLGPGTWRLQPIHVDDLVESLISLIDGAAAPPILHAAGGEVLGTDALTAALRAWLGLPPARALTLSERALRIMARIGDALPAAPLTTESLAMLAAGNVATGTATTTRLGRPLRAALMADPSFPADLLAARMVPVGLVLAGCLVAVWIGSGAASLLVPPHQAEALLAGLGLRGSVALFVTRAGAGLDLGLGLGLAVAMAVGRKRRAVLVAQLVTMAAYTGLATLALPSLWLDPFGPLLKNLAVLGATLALLAIGD